MTENPVAQRIRDTIDGNDIVLYMKGTRTEPRCGFSAQVCRILDYLGVSYSDVDVLQDDALRQGIKDFQNWPTVPQLYVKGEFLGGCDIVSDMFSTGQLKDVFEGHGLIAADSGPGN